MTDLLLVINLYFYIVQVMPKEISSGSSVTVNLTGSGFLTKPKFKGFLLQVQEVGSDNLVGTFQIHGEYSDKAQYRTCGLAQVSNRL